MKQDDIKRLIEDRSIPEPNTGCWLWTMGCFKHPYLNRGYGAVKPPGASNNRPAHRVSFEAFKGPIPSGMFVCHTCDTPSCVNPAHLWLGTNEENTADRHRKGREAKGDRNGARLHPERVNRGSDVGNSKLTEEDVAAIKARIATGEAYRPIAKAYGVTRELISIIKRDEAWTHVPWPDGQRIASPRCLPKRPLTEDDVRTIKRMLADGMRPIDVQEELGASPGQIADIRHGRCWKHVA